MSSHIGTLSQKLGDFTEISYRQHCMGHSKWFSRPLIANSMIYHLDIHLSSPWILIPYCGINCLGKSVAIFWIVTVNFNCSIMVMNDKTVVTNYTCVSMWIEFHFRFATYNWFMSHYNRDGAQRLKELVFLLAGLTVPLQRPWPSGVCVALSGAAPFSAKGWIISVSSFGLFIHK